jgi:hypothetical protein
LRDRYDIFAGKVRLLTITRFVQEERMAKSRDTKKDTKKKPSKTAKEKKKEKQEKKKDK